MEKINKMFFHLCKYEISVLSYLMCLLKKLVRVCKVSINGNECFAGIISTLFEIAVAKKPWLLQYVTDNLKYVPYKYKTSNCMKIVF